jgi:hypothetical protein
MSLPRLVKFWLWLSLLTSLAGWILSAIGQLNRAGYAVLFGLATAIVLLCRGTILAEPGQNTPSLQKICGRFRRPLPLAFATLTLLILIGGVLYPPTNHTAFTYRIPRVLNWLTHGGWFWVHTPDCRINTRACGIEWMATPLLLFTKSDRGMFLLNFIPYLLLPGLLFSVCTRLGVRPVVAWHWMWLLPTGYSFLLQAGSAGNDTFPAVYALAAVDFGLRAWTSRRISDLWHSLLAAALLTGAKASNLPLLLPWAVLIFPLLPLLRRKVVATALIVLVAAVVSFLPTAVLNTIYCGDWSGSKLEPAGMTMKNPVVGIWGNAFQILLNNFVPPVFPMAGWWNQNAPHIFPHTFVATVEKNFDTGYFWLGELPTEDWAGIGFGISVLLTAAVLASLRTKSSKLTSSSPLPLTVRRLVLLTPWVALLAYCVKSGMVTAARLISPYYTLLLPSLIIGAGHAEIVRSRWWRIASWLVILTAFVVLVTTPPRPLWPAQTILFAALKSKPGQPLLTRALKVYSVYAIRSDPLAQLRPLLPPDLKVVGFMGTADDIDISLWRPYFSRRVEHILLGDSPEQIRVRGIQYAVVSGLNLKEQDVTLDSWLQQANATLIATTNATVKVTDGPQPWHIVRFQN